ncbi:ribonuclease Oy-like isoform X2 [Orbicella faveolata]|uniref:ribonuclease Oy-like isoform X2 n=1 Tax=Orbicella faveolata TaxID=48498 RepID=UPI0009E1A04E|nr:ribonuclease Oy-like isoform X2 [Orbicella faveolata]
MHNSRERIKYRLQGTLDLFCVLVSLLRGTMFVPLIFIALLCLNVASFRLFSTEYDDGADFNLFVFTQWWPQTQCQYALGNVKNKSCVPSGITKWTIHGLWPTVGEEHKPVYCNSSWPFNGGDIEDLKPKLDLQWPSYDSPDAAEFWKHEWEKHGTCSTNLPFLDSEHKYFEVSLSLNVKYDIFSVLQQSGIVPSNEKAYQVKDIERALLDAYRVHPTVYCLPVKDSPQMLSYVELCLSKLELGPINCMNSTADCDYNKPVQYPPIVPVDGVM